MWGNSATNQNFKHPFPGCPIAPTIEAGKTLTWSVASGGYAGPRWVVTSGPSLGWSAYGNPVSFTPSVAGIHTVASSGEGSLYGSPTSGFSSVHGCFFPVVVTPPPPPPCNTMMVAGGPQPSTTTFSMGRNAGTSAFTYRTYTIHDRLQVLTPANQVIYDSGCTSTGGDTATGPWRTASVTFSGTTTLKVNVQPNCDPVTAGPTTEWAYRLACPM